MHPYENLDERFFWSSAVAKRNMFDIAGLWDPRHAIDRKAKVATYGSCFAQHIGRALKSRGFHWMITETGPAGANPELLKTYNYGVFTARTGNIYTASLLKQWVDWAFERASPPEEIWEKGGRFYDPFRPNIEPNGFASKDDLLASRRTAIACFRRSLTESNVFVFTLGLTESWFNEPHGYEYPMCPGTVAGQFDPDRHKFVNQDFGFIRKTLIETIKTIREQNPKLKILLTVSPVPLTATMSGNHILVATMESKPILRAIAGNIRNHFQFVDYFPSYEIINSSPFRGSFFEPNQRSVNHAGVDHVMDMFFSCLSQKFGGGVASEPVAAPAEKKPGSKKPAKPAKNVDDVVCEEELLAVFGN